MSVSGLRGLCVSELLERLEEVEQQIRTFSEELIDQLAVREELDYEKEVKNTFISALIDVQNRQKEHRELLKKKRKIKTAGAEQRSKRSHVPGTVRMIITHYQAHTKSTSAEISIDLCRTGTFSKPYTNPRLFLYAIIWLNS